ncbi:unnamed protein product [Caenorhabditis angaria]|uniref:Exosome complex component N-terminal domain-containing protein n=1 Tax=Caenorhabditis angaria TaxID=860376 RepID=A0A9P1IHG3_9PELO|nr:unnamed protein product [Caenorhabditis angaria]
MTINNQIVAPGDRILDRLGEYQMGNGLFESNNVIYASQAGYVNIYSHTDKSDQLVQIIEVRRHEDQIENELLPFTGAVVTAKVMALGLRYAKCDIISIGDKPFKKRFSALLPKNKLKPKEPELAEPFKNFTRPGDFILAKVVDDPSIKDKYVLSIAEDQLGVVLCVGSYGEPMMKKNENWQLFRNLGCWPILRNNETEEISENMMSKYIKKEDNTEMSHQASHFRLKKRTRFHFQPQIDPAADRIWSIGNVIYKRQQELARSFRNQDDSSFDYIDMISQNSESLRMWKARILEAARREKEREEKDRWKTIIKQKLILTTR